MKFWLPFPTAWLLFLISLVVWALGTVVFR
jgi:hypothetical protein